MKKTLAVVVVIMGIMYFGIYGCATKGSMKEQIDEALDARVGEIEEQVDANRGDIASLQQEIADQNKQVQKLMEKNEEVLTLTSNSVELGEEALARAEEAGKVAEGKLLYQVSFTGEAVRFGFDRSDLNKDAKAALDNFAEGIKAANKNIYIEIQGHTDDIGTEAYNTKLGQARANAVMRYLYVKHGIPLHRMNTFSYGELKPIADNSVDSNRVKNRRVALVVIQ